MEEFYKINQIIIEIDFCDIDYKNTIIGGENGFDLVKLNEYRFIDKDGEKY